MSNQAKEIVGTAHALVGMDEVSLKQLVVLFDRIGIQALFVERPKNPFTSPDFTKLQAWLAELGILFDLDVKKLKDATASDYAKTIDMIVEDTNLFTNPTYGMNVQEMIAGREDEEKIAEIRKRSREVEKRFADGSLDPVMIWQISQRLSTNTTRLFACQVRDVENVDSYPVIPFEFSAFEQDDPRLTKHDVVKICVGALPVPVEYVPWQQLIEYRNDPDTQSSFRVIKEFLSEVGRGSFTPVQIEDTMEYLVNRFRQNLEKHHINAVTTALYAYVVTTPEFVETLAGVGPDWGTRALFSMDHYKLGLLEGESTSPGSVVGFLTQSSFADAVGNVSG